MSREVANGHRPELLLAGLLRYGTWLASGVTALGFAIALTQGDPVTQQIVATSGIQVVASGIALFISLPVVRVLLMFALFVRDRDYRLVTVTAIVLITILAGVVIGVCMSRGVRLLLGWVLLAGWHALSAAKGVG